MYAPYLRTAALAAIVGGVLLMAADLQHLSTEFRDPDATMSMLVQRPVWVTHGATHIASALVLAFALPALYLAQAERLRTAGLVVFAVLVVSTTAYAGMTFIMGLATPHIPAEILDAEPSGLIAVAFLSHPLSALAWMAFAGLTIRAKVLPTWAAWTLLAGAFLEPVGDMLQLPITGAFLKGVALVAFGLAIRRLRASVTAPRPSETVA